MNTLSVVLVSAGLYAASSVSALSQDISFDGADYLTGNVHVGFTQNWNKAKQRRTASAQPSTTTALESIFTISKRISPSFRTGVDILYRDQKQESDTLVPGFNKPGHLARKKYEAGVFAIYQHQGFSVTPSARVGIDDYELERPDVLTGLTGKSKTRGFHAGGNLEASFLMPLTEWLYVRPVTDIDYEYLTAKAFTESGAGPNNVAFERVKDVRTWAQIGVGVAAVLPIGHESWIAPFVQARYRHNFNSDPVTTNAALASGYLNLGEVVLSTSQESDGVIVNTGFFLRGGAHLEVRAAYEGEYFPSSTAHTLSGRVKIAF